MAAAPQILDERDAETGRLRAALASALAELAATRSELVATRAELAALVELATRAQQQRDAADARTSELTAEVGRLAQLVGQGNDRVTELLAIAQRKKRRDRTTPVKPPEPPPELDAAAASNFANRPRPPELPPKVKPPPKEQRRTGRNPVPEHLVAEEHTAVPDACSGCGGTRLNVIDEEVEVKLHTVAEHQRRRVVHRKVCRCQDCGVRTTAESLPAPFARSKVTCEWLAWLVWMKFVMLVPLDRIRVDLAGRGVRVAMSFLVEQIREASELLEAVDCAHWKQLRAGSWMATDASGLKVIVPGVPGTHGGYLEVFRRDQLVVVQYEAEKGSDTLAAKLAGFQGVLVADAEHRHNAVFADGQVLEAGCNAHGRRRFEDAEAVQPALALEGGGFISAIYVAEGKAQKQGMVGAELRAWRQAQVPPILASFLAWMNAVEPTLVPSDPVAATIRYYRNHWAALFRFVDHPEIPIDNSATEREFQRVAKLRHSMLFAGGTEGAHRAAVLLGIVATCRAVGVDPRGYMTWAYQRRGTHKARFGLTAEQTTPAAYKAALAEAALAKG